MNILVVSQYFYPEKFRVNALCKELVKRGHSVTVLTGFPQYPKGKIYSGYGFHKPYEREWNQVKVERVKMLPRGKTPIGLFLNCFTFVAEGKKWVRHCDVKYDAVYVFEVSPVTVGLPAVYYKKKYGTPIYFNVQDLWPESVETVLGIHNRLVIGIIRQIVDKIYSASDCILCSSKGFTEAIASTGVERDKLKFWPQFCERPHFTDVTAPELFKKSNFNIVFTGNVGNAQGLDLLLDTAKILKNSNIRWFIVGDGRAKERLLKRVSDLKIEKNVIFTDSMSEAEANRYIHFADCAYLSLTDDKLFNITLPAKLQSYMACGTPVLAATGGECKDIIEKAECGIVSLQDPDSLALAATEMSKMSIEKMQTFKINAKKIYEKYFTLSVITDSLEEYFNEYIKKDGNN